MVRILSVLTLSLGVVSSAACFHATVETGLPLTTTTVDQHWASGYLWGLLPPPVVTAAVACPGGRVSKVETRHSFLNELAAIGTLGVYTPMEIKVTCSS